MGTHCFVEALAASSHLGYTILKSLVSFDHDITVLFLKKKMCRGSLAGAHMKARELLASRKTGVGYILMCRFRVQPSSYPLAMS